MKLSAKIKLPANAIPVKALRTALDDALSQGSADASAKLTRPTGSWRHKAAMQTDVRGDTATAGTDDEIYGYVSEGTRPHTIVAKNAKVLAFGPSAPKTQVGSLGSSSGSRGAVSVFRKRVRHPGTKARKFDETAGKELEREWPATVQKKLDEAAR